MVAASGTRRLLRTAVVDAVTAGIVEGTIRPGSRLSVDGLARRFMVAPSTVRAALPVLAVRGLVELRPGRSPRVCSFAEASEDAAVSLGVLMRGVVMVTVPSLDRRTAPQAVELVRKTFTTVRHPDAADIRLLAVEGYQRWADLCVNSALSSVLETRASALAIAATMEDPGVTPLSVLGSLRDLRWAIERGDPFGARRAISVMHGL